MGTFKISVGAAVVMAAIQLAPSTAWADTFVPSSRVSSSFATKTPVSGKTAASVYCADHSVLFHQDYSPAIAVNLITGQDAGQYGAYWFGLVSPDKRTILYLALDGTWKTYRGGYYPPAGRYDNGLPNELGSDVALPVDGYTTDALVGYEIFVADGIITQTNLDMISKRRDLLEKNKAYFQSKGSWSAAYEDDDTFKLAYTMRDMEVNNKYHSLGTVPFIDCTPPNQYNK